MSEEKPQSFLSLVLYATLLTCLLLPLIFLLVSFLVKVNSHLTPADKDEMLMIMYVY